MQLVIDQSFIAALLNVAYLEFWWKVEVDQTCLHNNSNFFSYTWSEEDVRNPLFFPLSGFPLLLWFNIPFLTNIEELWGQEAESPSFCAVRVAKTEDINNH